MLHWRIRGRRDAEVCCTGRSGGSVSRRCCPVPRGVLLVGSASVWRMRDSFVLTGRGRGGARGFRWRDTTAELRGIMCENGNNKLNSRRHDWRELQKLTVVCLRKHKQ